MVRKHSELAKEHLTDGRSRAFPASVVRSPPFRPRFVPLVRVTPGALFPLVRRSYILYHPPFGPSRPVSLPSSQARSAMAASPALGGAAGLLGYGAVGNEGMGGVPLPLGMGPYGTVGPTGLPLDVLSPLGPDAGRRLRTQKDAEALRDATNIVLPTIRKFSEQAKKDDFARSMASRGIAQNIATNAALTQGMAAATRQLGLTGAEQAGQALTQQYNY